MVINGNYKWEVLTCAKLNVNFTQCFEGQVPEYVRCTIDNGPPRHSAAPPRHSEIKPFSRTLILAGTGQHLCPKEVMVWLAFWKKELY